MPRASKGAPVVRAPARRPGFGAASPTVRRRGRARGGGLVIRIHEAAGSSRTSWDAAVRDAIAAGRREHPEVLSVEVVRLSGEVAGGRIRSYRAAVRLAYRQPVRGP